MAWYMKSRLKWRKHNENKIQNVKTIDVSSASMVITDRDRKGEQVKTIGDLIGNESIEEYEYSIDDVEEASETNDDDSTKDNT